MGRAEGLGLGSDRGQCLDLVRLVLCGQMVCQAEELGKQREPWPPHPTTHWTGPSPLPSAGTWPEDSTSENLVQPAWEELERKGSLRPSSRAPPHVLHFPDSKRHIGKVSISATSTAIARGGRHQDQNGSANPGALGGMHRDSESERPLEAEPGADWKCGCGEEESQLTWLRSLKAECGGRGGEVHALHPGDSGTGGRRGAGVREMRR